MEKGNAVLKGPVLLTAVFLILAFLIYFGFSDVDISDPFLLLVIIIPLLSVFGLIILLIWLAIILGANQLAFHPHAFALPSGSIRATLALSLVAVFIASGLYLAGNKDLTSGITSYGFDLPPGSSVASTEFEKFEKGLPTGVTALRSTYVKDGTTIQRVEVVSTAASQARIDLAKQVLTVIATALVAIIGFYFGSKTATQAQQADAASVLSREDRKAAAAAAAAKADKSDGTVKEVEKLAERADRANRTTAQALAEADSADPRYPILKKNAEVVDKASASCAKALALCKARAAEIRVLAEQIATKTEPTFDVAAAAKTIDEKLADLQRQQTIANSAANKAVKAAAFSASA